MLRFKIDENLPVEVADILRVAGHDAATVYEQGLRGKPDFNIAAVCKQEGRVIVTLDVGFSDIRTYPPGEYVGILVFRLKRQDKPHVLNMVQRILPMLSEEQLAERLWIVEEERIRTRG